jgi:hypothetical protein
VNCLSLSFQLTKKLTGVTMNNLTQTQKDAKQAYLNKQLEYKCSNGYQDADKNERAAIIRQTDGFLPVTTIKSEKNFWLKFRQNSKDSMKKDSF